MHEVLVNRLGGLSLPRKSVVRLTDRPDMTLDVYRGRKTTIQQHLSEALRRTDVMVATSSTATRTDERHPVLRPWIRSIEVLGGVGCG